MKKRYLGLLAGFMSLAFLAGCNGGNNGAENVAPEIKGVKDTASVVSGSAFNALDGITATDKEDGDLTGKIVVSSTPALNFVNGVATPSKAGTYELTYSVTDSGNKTAESYSTLTVTKRTGEAQEYLKFDFNTDAEAESHGWAGTVGGSAAGTAALKEGGYVFDVTNPGGGDGDVKLSKTLDLKAADYKVKIWAKSNVKTYAHFLARDAKAEKWKTFAEDYNLEIKPEIKAFELDFSSDKDGNQTEILFNMGKITFGDGTPEAYKVTVDKVEVYEITGTETEKPIYTQNFADGLADMAVSTADNATASIANEGGAAKVTIGAYSPETGDDWRIKAALPMTGKTVEKDKKYYINFKATAEKAQEIIVCAESNAKEWQQRACFISVNLAAGETKEAKLSFVAGDIGPVEDLVIRFYLGKHAETVTSNVVTFDDVAFGTLEGDKKTEKTLDRFMAYGKGSQNAENPHYIWDTFNGTDEDLEAGVGTVWTEGGKLYYRIDQGATTDWHNKLVFGYTGNPLELPQDSYFTVTFKAKASKNVSCGMFLNQLGEWAPRLKENVDFTTETKEYTFTTTDILVTQMNFELLFQFGSTATAELGEVTIEISEMKIMQSIVS